MRSTAISKTMVPDIADSASQFTKWLLINNTLVTMRRGWLWNERVVPFAVEVVATQRALFEAFHLLVGDLDAVGVAAGVQFGVHGHPGAGGGRGDGVDDDLMALEWPTAPVHPDVREQPVLDLLPFGCSGRQVADGDGQPGLVGEVGELGFP